MARVLKGSRSFTCTPPRSIPNRNEQYLPAFAFPAIADTHLPTPEGWKAELAWGCWLRSETVTCPKAVTIPLLTGFNVEQLR